MQRFSIKYRLPSDPVDRTRRAVKYRNTKSQAVLAIAVDERVHETSIIEIGCHSRPDPPVQ